MIPDNRSHGVGQGLLSTGAVAVAVVAAAVVVVPPAKLIQASIQKGNAFFPPPVLRKYTKPGGMGQLTRGGTTDSPRRGNEDRRQRSDVEGEAAARASRVGRAADHVADGLAGGEAGHGDRGAGAGVGEDADHVGLLHGDDVRVRVRRVRLVGDVAARLGHGGVADLVDGRDPLVEVRVRVVTRRPQRLAVVGVGAARVLLLLAVVDDGDAVCQDREGDRVLDEVCVAGQRCESDLIVVLHEAAQRAGAH